LSEALKWACQNEERLAAKSPALIEIAETPLMDAHENLEELMARYQLGDLDAATALIQSISPKLYRFFAAQSVSRVEADDLLQETWLRIHKVRHTYRAGEPVIAWFYAIARHVRVDHYRKAMRTTLRELELDETAGTAEAAAAGRSDELDALLAPLSSGEREVVEMLKVEGLSLEEVARATSSTVGSVKQKAHRAYKKLRVAFGFSKEKGEGPR
jgi:RNA polymerase sigma-70 factor, ECF subfamily